MSLKAVHIVFVIAALLLCAGFGWWSLAAFGETGSGTSLALGVLSLVASGVLVYYGFWFLRKLKGWSYL